VNSGSLLSASGAATPARNDRARQGAWRRWIGSGAAAFVCFELLHTKGDLGGGRDATVEVLERWGERPDIVLQGR
jgi:hypothetical protein